MAEWREHSTTNLRVAGSIIASAISFHKYVCTQYDPNMCDKNHLPLNYWSMHFTIYRRLTSGRNILPGRKVTPYEQKIKLLLLKEVRKSWYIIWTLSIIINYKFSRRLSVSPSVFPSAQVLPYFSQLCFDEFKWKLEYSFSMSSCRSSSTVVPIYKLCWLVGDFCVAGNTCS